MLADGAVADERRDQQATGSPSRRPAGRRTGSDRAATRRRCPAAGAGRAARRTRPAPSSVGGPRPRATPGRRALLAPSVTVDAAGDAACHVRRMGSRRASRPARRSATGAGRATRRAGPRRTPGPGVPGGSAGPRAPAAPAPSACDCAAVHFSGAEREWSTSDFGIAVSTDRAASACSPNPRTHSGSGPSSGSPVKNFAAMHPPWQESKTEHARTPRRSAGAAGRRTARRPATRPRTARRRGRCRPGSSRGSRTGTRRRRPPGRSGTPPARRRTGSARAAPARRPTGGRTSRR